MIVSARRGGSTVATSIPALVNPTAQRWARESINLTTLAASRKLGFAPTIESPSERGEAQPARPVPASMPASASNAPGTSR
jgi:hypothetical protein